MTSAHVLDDPPIPYFKLELIKQSFAVRVVFGVMLALSVVFGVVLGVVIDVVLVVVEVPVAFIIILLAIISFSLELTFSQRVVDKNKGDHNLKIKLVNYTDKYIVDLLSRTNRVDLNNNLIDNLNKINGVKVVIES